MANDLRLHDTITKESVRILKELTPFARKLKRPTEEIFGREGMKGGESARIRKPARFIGGDGDAVTVENMVEEQITMNMEPLTNQAVSFTDREFALDIDLFSERWIRPAMVSISSRIESRLMQKATEAAANAVGIPGTVPNSSATYLAANQVLTEFGAPRSDRSIFVTPEMSASIVGGVQALQNPATSISKQYLEAEMFRAWNFTWYETTSHQTLTLGTTASSTPLVNDTMVDGDAVVTTDGWNADASNIIKGQTFTFAGVYGVHPQNRTSTGRLKQFVVTQSTDDTSGAMTINFDPPIKGPGNPHQNVTAIPANNAALLFDNAAAGTPVAYSGVETPLGLACHPDAFMFVTVPLPKHKDMAVSQVTRDPATGISVRFQQQSEIRTTMNICRWDVLWGFAAPYPELALKIYS